MLILLVIVRLKPVALLATEEACLVHIMDVRYGGLTHDCESCGVEATFHNLRDRRVYACPECLFQITPTADTIFHDTRTRSFRGSMRCICSPPRGMG